MPVEVVGGNVEDGSHPWMELLNGFKLEAGNLQHAVALLAGGRNHGDHRRPDVAAHLNFFSGIVQNLANQGSGGGLAVGAGDGDNLSTQKTRGQLHFADDRHAELASLH